MENAELHNKSGYIALLELIYCQNQQPDGFQRLALGSGSQDLKGCELDFLKFGHQSYFVPIFCSRKLPRNEGRIVIEEMLGTRF